MPSSSENFSLSGPNPRVDINWNDVNYRRLVIACLVNGVYILESDRQQNRDEIEALATPWWKSFHFQLHHKLVDNNDSIFGAIYEYKYPNPAPSFPQYVIAFRGTLMKKETVLRDGKLNFKCFYNKLHKSSSFQLAMDCVLVTMSGGARVWLAGHSLGSAMALLAGKNMAKMGSVVSAGLSRDVNGCQHHETEDHEPFNVPLSSWIPYHFVNPHYPICSEYIGYFEQRKKMRAKILGGVDRFLTKSCMDSGSEPLNLIPSADLTINRCQLTEFQGPFCKYKKFKRAHGIQQWWNYGPCDSLRYEYNTTNYVE